MPAEPLKFSSQMSQLVVPRDVAKFLKEYHIPTRNGTIYEPIYFRPYNPRGTIDISQMYDNTGAFAYLDYRSFYIGRYSLYINLNPKSSNYGKVFMDMNGVKEYPSFTEFLRKKYLEQKN